MSLPEARAKLVNRGFTEEAVNAILSPFHSRADITSAELRHAAFVYLVRN